MIACKGIHLMLEPPAVQQIGMSAPQIHQISIRNAGKLFKPCRIAPAHPLQLVSCTSRSQVQLKTSSIYGHRHSTTVVFSSIVDTPWMLSNTEQFVGKIIQQQQQQQQVPKQSTASTSVAKASITKQRQPIQHMLQTFSLLLLGIVSLPLMNIIRAANLGVSGMTAGIQAVALLLKSVTVPTPPSPLAWFTLALLWICSASLPMLHQVVLPLVGFVHSTACKIASNAVHSFAQAWHYVCHTQPTTNIPQLPDATSMGSPNAFPQLAVVLLLMYCASWVLQPVHVIVTTRLGRVGSTNHPRMFLGGRPILKSGEFWWTVTRITLMLITVCIAYHYRPLACQAAAALLACSLQLVGICIEQIA